MSITSLPLDQALVTHRERLKAMVRLRMDRRLLGRIDPSDVIQEAFIDAAQRWQAYQAEPTMPVFLWLRFLTAQRLLMLHRQHLGAKVRDVRREVLLHQGGLPSATSESLAAHLLGRLSSPSHAAMRVEMQVRLQEALNGLEPLDREVLTLRHFELLSNTETAQVLQIGESAASNRYVRALKRLKEVLELIPGFVD